MRKSRRVGGSTAAGWRGLAVAVGVFTFLGLTVPSQAQEPVDCDSVNLELSDHFSSPICYSSRFRTGGTIGRNQTIHGESRDYMVHFQSSRSGAGNTYVSAIDFDMLMGFYGLTDRQKILGTERELGDGFRYVTVGGRGLHSCILLLKQVRPIRSGFRSQYYGLACEKGQEGEYGPEDAASLLDLIKDY